MKKLMIIPVMLMAVLVASSGFAKGSENLVDKSFCHSFHHVKNVHRFNKENGFTEYAFMMKGKYVSALYDASGNLVEADFSISFEELPAKAKEFIQSEFNAPCFTEITRVEYKQNACYRVHFESNGLEYTLAATPAGEVVVGY